MGLFTEDTVALVTGASRGIGRAVALDLAAEGATVLVNYNKSDEEAKAVVQEIESRGDRAHLFQADIADETQVRTMIRSIGKEFGRLDVLVNNAGITADGFVVMMSAKKWEDVIRTNLTGTFFCTREALKLMGRRRKGSIVNISSVSGIAGLEGQLNYSASKGGMIAFTKGLAREAAAFGIRANVVAPGFVDTDMTRKVPAELLKLALQLVALKRVGRPEEIANVVTFVASEKASYMTGKVVVVDGGMAVS